MSYDINMPRSFGTVSDDGSNEGDRYSISGSELEVMAKVFSTLISVCGVKASDNAKGSDKIDLGS